ncbi:MAG: hypothetical protein HC945_01855 [Nitrosarchaeum sp.]|nr:hypothetical protein [Nitrosarchaeum sp.]
MQIGDQSAANDVRVWRCRWDGGSGQGIRTYSALRTDIAFCSWSDWSGTGILLGVTDGTRTTTIRYCGLFDTPPGYSVAGSEAIRTGFGSRGIDSGILIYRTKIRNWNGDANKEMLKFSHSSNTVRQVTVVDCDGHLANRGGQNNRYEGCIVRDCRGLGIEDGFLPSRMNLVLGCLVEGSKPLGGPCEIIIRGGDVQPGVEINGTHNLAEGTVVSGCTGPIDVGHLYSGDTLKARDTRIRQHSGSISLDPNGQEDTDSQPGATETLYKWPALWEPADADVGPLAGPFLTGGGPETPEEWWEQAFPGSAFKIPIGTGAVYVDVPELAAHQGGGTFNGGTNNFAIWSDLNEASDPTRTITGSGGELPVTAKMANDWPPILSGGEASILGDRDTLKAYSIVGQTKNADGSVRSATIARSSLMTENSHGTTLNYTRRGTSASGINNHDTVLWWQDVCTPGRAIRSAIGLVVPRGVSGHSSPQVLGKGIQTPAGWADFDAHLDTRNLGPLKYGARLGIPPTVNYVTAINGLSNGAMTHPTEAKEASIRLFRGLCVKGCIVVDGGSQPNFRLNGRGTFGAFTNDTLVQQFWTDMIYIMRQLLWQNLKLVSNAVPGATAVVADSGGNPVYSGSIGTLTNPVGGGVALTEEDVP